MTNSDLENIRAVAPEWAAADPDGTVNVYDKPPGLSLVVTNRSAKMQAGTVEATQLGALMIDRHRPAIPVD